MEIRLPHDQEAHITALAAAVGSSMDDVVQEALGAWAERQTVLAEIRASLDVARAGIAAGRGTVITQESMHTLTDAIKRRGRELAAAQKSPQPL